MSYFIKSCQYPPKGYRSFGPIRASIYGGNDYSKYANARRNSVPTFARV